MPDEEEDVTPETPTQVNEAGAVREGRWTPTPKTPLELTWNDKRFLRSIRISPE